MKKTVYIGRRQVPEPQRVPTPYTPIPSVPISSRARAHGARGSLPASSQMVRKKKQVHILGVIK